MLSYLRLLLASRHIWLTISGLITFCLFLFVVTDAIVFNWQYSGFGPRTLWDWMELLIVPAVLAIGGILFNRAEQANERLLAEQKAKEDLLRADRRAEIDRNIAADGLREATLQTYLDRMSDLLLHEMLREAAADAEVRAVARARTLTAIRQLEGDSRRQMALLRFLIESNLLHNNEAVIDMHDAYLVHAHLDNANLCRVNLRGVNLMKATLQGANLTGVNLHESCLYDVSLIMANLHQANLTNADLRKAKLGKANLSGADLSGADLSGADLIGSSVTSKQLMFARSLAGAVMPDGSLHD